jgi:hypothetical protein
VGNSFACLRLQSDLLKMFPPAKEIREAHKEANKHLLHQDIT